MVQFRGFLVYHFSFFDWFLFLSCLGLAKQPLIWRPTFLQNCARGYRCTLVLLRPRASIYFLKSCICLKRIIWFYLEIWCSISVIVSLQFPLLFHCDWLRLVGWKLITMKMVRSFPKIIWSESRNYVAFFLNVHFPSLYSSAGTWKHCVSTTYNWHNMGCFFLPRVVVKVTPKNTFCIFNF